METIITVVAEKGSSRMLMAEVTLMVAVAEEVTLVVAEITKGQTETTGTEVVFKTS